MSASHEQLSFKELPDSELFDFPVNVEGNDPEIPDLKHHQVPADKTLVLVGTSGLRSVEIAFKLTTNNYKLPKIYIVDYGRQVKYFWLDFQKFCAKERNQELFLAKLESFMTDRVVWFSYKNENNYNRARDGSTYIESLIKGYSFALFKAIIANTQFVSQNWKNPEVFKELQQAIKKEKNPHVCVYASNILGMNSIATQQKIAANIASLSPVLTLHSNYVGMLSVPTRFYIFVVSNPEYVLQTMSQADDLSELEGALFMKSIRELFAKYRMSTTYSDCMEETLCLVVRQALFQKTGVSDSTIMTTASTFIIHPRDPACVLFKLTISAAAAQKILQYFNSLEKNSAVIEFASSNNINIKIKGSVLNSDQFTEDLIERINCFDQERRDKYWLANGCLSKNTRQCREDLIKITATCPENLKPVISLLNTALNRVYLSPYEVENLLVRLENHQPHSPYFRAKIELPYQKELKTLAQHIRTILILNKEYGDCAENLVVRATPASS